MWPESRSREGFSLSCSLNQDTLQFRSRPPCCKESQTSPHGEWRDHIRAVYMKRNWGPLMKAQNQPPDVWVTSLYVSVSQPWYHWHFGKDNYFRGECLVYCMLFSHFPGLHHQMLVATPPHPPKKFWQSKMILDIAKYPGQNISWELLIFVQNMILLHIVT